MTVIYPARGRKNAATKSAGFLETVETLKVIRPGLTQQGLPLSSRRIESIESNPGGITFNTFNTFNVSTVSPLSKKPASWDEFRVRIRGEYAVRHDGETLEDHVHEISRATLERWSMLRALDHDRWEYWLPLCPVCRELE